MRRVARLGHRGRRHRRPRLAGDARRRGPAVHSLAGQSDHAVDHTERLVAAVKPIKAAKPVAPVAADRPLDPYLPESGNRGYRVSRYELELTYKVVSNRLDGRAKIIATTTDVRAKYSLDLAQSM